MSSKIFHVIDCLKNAIDSSADASRCVRFFLSEEVSCLFLSKSSSLVKADSDGESREQKAISEFQNSHFENEAKCKSFLRKWLRTLPRFETEAWGYSEIRYLTIIPRVHVGYETVDSLYPTSASGIIVLLKTPTKYREFFRFYL